MGLVGSVRGVLWARVALGTGVTCLAGRWNPVVVAQQMATVERLAPGRAFLGVGGRADERLRRRSAGTLRVYGDEVLPELHA